MDKAQEKKLDWKRPDQVMKLHKFKLRKFALQARFNGTSINEKTSNSTPVAAKSTTSSSQPASRKRKNPFARNETNKKPKEDIDLDNISADSTFELLNTTLPACASSLNQSAETSALLDTTLTLESVESQPVVEEPKGKPYIPMNWTLRTKLRIMSPKPFAWKGNLKATEEASGTTAYIRCLNIGEQQTTLDTSPNARFHQCCLVWQHPSIPWIEMFPRSQGKMNVSSNNFVAMNQTMKDVYYKKWRSSFRSLFQLLRVGQCPYFYVCGNNFTVLFRAAGICGISEVQALLTPTTRGLREALKNEDIQFTMPLKPKEKRQSLDPDEINAINDDDELNDTWLKSVGIEESEIRKIGHSQAKVLTGRESDIDHLHESLIFVTGVEVQALFNFLINCKTIMTSVGPYSGIPPTLLSPVGFHGATLEPLNVRTSTVCSGTEKFHSLELSGPIMPNVLSSLCSLMTLEQLEKFSVSSAQLTNTNAFTLAKHGRHLDDMTKEKLPQSVFGLENLTDCGFNKDLLGHFCNPDPNRIQLFESLTCVNELFTWT